MLIAMDGFETGLITQTDVGRDSGAFQTRTGRDGIGVAIGSDESSAVVNGRLIYKRFISGSDTIYGHFGLYFVRFGDTSLGGQAWGIFTNSGALQHLALTFDVLGHAQLRLGGASGTILQTSTLIMPPVAAWHSCEFKTTIHNTTGEFILKIDGVEYLNYTGDTMNGGTSTRPDMVGFGSKSGQNAWDDLFIVDTTGLAENSWTGEISIAGIRPAGNGAHSDLVGSDGNSVNNYQQVDEYPINTTDYNASSTTGAIDTYDMSAVGKVGTVVGVQQIAYAAKSDTGPKSFKHVMRSNSTTELKSAAVPLSTTYVVYVGPFWDLDADGSAWTVTKVNNHEFGFEVV